MNIKELVNESLEHLAHKVGLDLYTQGHEAVLAGDTRTLRYVIFNTNPKFIPEFLVKLVTYNEKFRYIKHEKLEEAAWIIYDGLRQRQPIREIEKTMGIELSSLFDGSIIRKIPSPRDLEIYLLNIHLKKYWKNDDCFYSVAKELDQQSPK